MENKTALIVTSIAKPNEVMRQLAEGCRKKGWDFIVIGDEKSPSDFYIEGCDFYSLERQRELEFEFARKCPVRHYARKNIGYLTALRRKANVIVETDDDNFPNKEFWSERSRKKEASVIEDSGWVNAYKYFTYENIWPRGFALEELKKELPELKKLSRIQLESPIQQGLADENPDVDAVYRLVLPLPVMFDKEPVLGLSKGSVCPFNSQNTTWFSECFELMYLPFYCSFRMTDIWRSFVAQRIAQENGWPVIFHGPTVYQKRNVHDLMKDFEDEVPGYLNNARIWEILSELNLKKGREYNGDNLRICYDALISAGHVGKEEMGLLESWLSDINNIR